MKFENISMFCRCNTNYLVLYFVFGKDSTVKKSTIYSNNSMMIDVTFQGYADASSLSHVIRSVTKEKLL